MFGGHFWDRLGRLVFVLLCSGICNKAKRDNRKWVTAQEVFRGGLGNMSGSFLARLLGACLGDVREYVGRCIDRGYDAFGR